MAKFLFPIGIVVVVVAGVAGGSLIVLAVVSMLNGLRLRTRRDVSRGPRMRASSHALHAVQLDSIRFDWHCTVECRASICKVGPQAPASVCVIKLAATQDERTIRCQASTASDNGNQNDDESRADETSGTCEGPALGPVVAGGVVRCRLLWIHVASLSLLLLPQRAHVSARLLSSGHPTGATRAPHTTQTPASPLTSALAGTSG